MVNHQFGREQWIDQPRIAAHALDRFAHGGQIHYRWHAGEILKQNAGRHERNFFFRGPWLPVCQRANVIGPHKSPVLAAQKIFEQDTK